MRLTDEQLEELERMEKAATPGPWQWVDTQVYGDPAEGPDFNAIVGPPKDPNKKPYPTDSSERVLDFELPIENKHNADLIIALRNAAPSLIEEVRELRKELANIRKHGDCRHRYTTKYADGHVACMSCGEQIDAAMKESQ